MRIAVTAGHQRSLHSIAVVEGLARRGHEVVLVIEVAVLDRGRARALVRQWGVRRALAKVVSRFGPGRAGGSAGGEVALLADHLRREGMAGSVPAAAGTVGADHLRVRSLNDAEPVDALGAARPDLLVYAGGGIIRPALAGIPPRGVLNAHGGPLPRFRGMNATEWALWFGVAPEVTVHLIDDGVDTGPLLRAHPVPVLAGDRIVDLRGRAALIGVEALLDAVDALAAGELDPRPQRPEDGLQHFVMAPAMVEVLDRWLAEGRTPRAAP